MIFNLEAVHIHCSLSFLISSPSSPPRHRAYLTHDLDLFSGLPLLAHDTDTFDLTLPTFTIHHNPLLLLLGSTRLPLFLLFLRCLLFRYHHSRINKRILPFEPVVDEVVTPLLDVEGAACLRNPVEPEQLTLPAVVAYQLPLPVTELKDARGQHLIFLHGEVKQGVRVHERLRGLL
jgi:hypothetical protein